MNRTRELGSLSKSLPPPAKRSAIGLFAAFAGDIAKNPFAYLLALPAIAYTCIFGYFTYPYMLVAFQKFDYRKGLFSSDWVGLANFQFLFKTPYTMHVVANTIKLNLMFLVSVTVFAVVLALLLNEVRSRWFLRITQSTMLFPNYLSWIVVSYVLYSFFSTDYGIVDQALQKLGLERINWYSKPESWPWILTGMKIWKDAGLTAVIYLASMTGIDQSLYESAALDGATRWQQTRRITLPLIMPTVVILTLLSLGRIMYGDFGMIYAIVSDNGVLFPTTDVIDTYVFRILRQTGDPAESTAVGFLQSGIGFVLVYATNGITRRYYKDGALY